MSTGVRVRFAPSPTGFMHLGNARTAVVNWLFARHHGGVFVLRIEDTDRERSTEEAVGVILDSMRWLGLDWDEGPYRQSERFDLYRRRAGELIESGEAYRCWCTPEELDERRERSLAEKRKPKYDGRCRGRAEPRPGVEPVIRFRAPEDGATTVGDIIQGEVTTRNEELDDLVLVRADGTPTYNFTVVVDDHEMAITHVIRGADHLSNTFRQVQIYRALAWPLPEFAHLPLILGPDRSKLSKRHGAVSVTQYRDDGFLPESMVNALVRLGWSHGDREVFSVAELVGLFDLADVGKAPSIFDFAKLRSKYNAEHVKAAPVERLCSLLAEHLPGQGIDGVRADDPRLPLLVEALRERSPTLADMARAARPMLVDPVEIDAGAAAKHLRPEAAPALRELAARFGAREDIDRLAAMALFGDVAAARGVPLGKIAQPARVALTGSAVSPPIDVVAAVLGPRRTAERLEAGAAIAERSAPPL
ncbi:MAG: glutamate--tRNA ligase [Myxococcota bacterium]|nr:glutamate--tRNA ligase [Myxococcota bacterium]